MSSEASLRSGFGDDHESHPQLRALHQPADFNWPSVFLIHRSLGGGARRWSGRSGEASAGTGPRVDHATACRRRLAARICHTLWSQARDRRTANRPLARAKEDGDVCRGRPHCAWRAARSLCGCRADRARESEPGGAHVAERCCGVHACSGHPPRAGQQHRQQCLPTGDREHGLLPCLWMLVDRALCDAWLQRATQPLGRRSDARRRRLRSLRRGGLRGSVQPPYWDLGAWRSGVGTGRRSGTGVRSTGPYRPSHQSGPWGRKARGWHERRRWSGQPFCGVTCRPSTPVSRLSSRTTQREH